MSAIASPGLEMLGFTPLLSIPWPHSWSKMAAISPVLRQASRCRGRSCTLAPFQNALQVWLMFTLASSERLQPGVGRAGSRAPAR